MTIKLLTPRGQYPVNAIVTFDAATEAALVADKVATTNLTGGTAYVAPAAGNTPQVVSNVSYAGGKLFDGNGNEITSLVSGAGNLAGVLLRDTSQRPLVTKSTSGVVSTASYATGANAVVPSSQIPVAFKSQQGIMWKISAFAGAVGWSNSMFAISVTGVCWRWDAGTGWRTTGWSFTMSALKMLYVDSRGYIYYSNGTAVSALSRVIWRSTDGGTTFAACLTLPGSQDTPAPMCEDDVGSLYIAAYGYGTVGTPDFVDRNTNLAANSRSLWKSTDGGASWSNISAGFPLAGGFTGSASIQRHLHGVFWDEQRKLLFVTHGDAAAGSPILVSNDRGTTFTAWANTSQATAIAFTATSIIYASDQSTDMRLYRCNCGVNCSLSALVAQTPLPTLDWTNFGFADNTVTTVGFCWNAWTMPSGALVFPVGGGLGTATMVVASVDDGVTWTILDNTAGAGFSYYNQNAVSQKGGAWDGYIYGTDITLSGALAQLAVHKIGASLTVNAASGSVIGDGVRTPMKRYMDGQPKNAVVQQLTADYPEHITATSVYSIFDSNGFALGAIGTRPIINETWEGTLTGWANALASGGAVTQAATNRAKTGTKSLLCDLSGGSGTSVASCRKTITTTVDGDELWAAADTYFEALTSPVEFFELNAGASSLNANTTRWQLGINGNFYSTVGFTPPAAAWVRWKLALRIHATDGRVRFWVDTGSGYRLAIDIEGVSTRTAQINQAGFKAASTTLTKVNHDNCAVGLNGDPDIRGPLALTNTLQSAVREGIYT